MQKPLISLYSSVNESGVEFHISFLIAVVTGFFPQDEYNVHGWKCQQDQEHSVLKAMTESGMEAEAIMKFINLYMSVILHFQFM